MLAPNTYEITISQSKVLEVSVLEYESEDMKYDA
jgi:hypothetical protein